MRRTVKWARNTDNFAVFEFKGPDKMRTLYLPLSMLNAGAKGPAMFDIIFSQRPFQAHETQTAELLRLQRENREMRTKLDEINRILEKHYPV